MKQLIITREDLKLSRGKLAAQVAHASLGGYLQSPNKEWIDSGMTKIILVVKDLEELLDLQVEGLNTYLVRDLGRTEIPKGTITCLSIGPATNEQLKQFNNLKLL